MRARDLSPVAQLILKCQKTGDKTHFFKADVSSPASIALACKEITTRLGSPTIAVLNAGVFTHNTMLDISETELRRTVDINFLGVVFCVKEFLPAMIAANRGHVLVTSSVTAFISTVGHVHYSAAKAALVAAVEGLQTELKHAHGNPSVKVSSVLPAIVNTSMSAGRSQPATSFLLPVLEPAQVAQYMVDILKRGER